MPFKYACTVDGHYTLATKGKKWFYVSTDKHRIMQPVGPFTADHAALEAAQLLENDYHKHKVKK